MAAPGTLAFAEIHAQYTRVVHGIALAHVGAADADDVAQEAFLRIHAALPALRDPAALPAWVCRIARTAAIDHLRARRARPAAVPLPDDHPAPPGPEDGSDTRERVLRCIAQLPEAYRETLLLRLAEGLTGPEIAARTGLTHGSVRVNLSRGMALLRPLLREDGWT